MSKKNKEQKKELTPKERRKKKLKAFIFEIILLIVLLIVFYFWSLVSKIDFQSMDEEEAGINSELDVSQLKGYTNIAIFGLDNRSGSNYDTGNSDVIMIASINNDTKEVRLVSVYRDTYLNVYDDTFRKANSAYAKGGAKAAVQMLNKNLDLNITNFVCVDWTAVIETVDDLGGVEIDVQENEVGLINAYVDDTSNWVSSANPGHISGPGLQTLNGTQAVAYARIRYTAGDDFMRAARQRLVLQAMMSKVKSASLTSLVGIVNSVVDDISTSFSVPELISLAGVAPKYDIVGTMGFPQGLTCSNIGVESCVIPVELDNNVQWLHSYLFPDESYQMTNTVQGLSDTIVSTTGFSEENTTLYNLDKWLETADPEWEATHSTEGGEDTNNQ